MELRLLCAVCTAICIYSNAAMAVSFRPLGDLGGGDFRSAADGVTADGYTIVGSAINPDGFTEAWIADLRVAPPATTPVDLSGTIKTPDGTDICAMVPKNTKWTIGG